MIPPFDIFQIMQDKQPLWLESAFTLETAKARVRELGESRPGEYLILSHKTGHQITLIVGKSEMPELAIEAIMVRIRE